jgi:hypothetical protein
MYSSDLTKKRRDQTLYANYLIQKTQVQEGVQGQLNLESGSGRANAESTKINITDGIAATTLEEQQAILNNINLPTTESTPAPAPLTNIDVLVIGDANIATSGIPTYLQAARTALGFTQTLTISTQASIVGYTGADMINYDVVIIYNGGGQGYNASFGSNLNAFVAAGGHLIMGSFLWGNVPAPSGLTYTNTSTYVYNGSMSLITISSVTYPSSHPITTGLGTSWGGTQENIPSPITLQASATTLAQYSNGTSALAVREVGSSRLVGLNRSPAYLTYASNQNLTKIMCNAIYWCMGVLS